METETKTINVSPDERILIESFIGKWFSADWNGLMDVVDKINHLSGNNPFLESRVVINGTKCKIVCGTRIFKVHTIKTINSVYGCVLQFVKHWLTDNNQKENGNRNS